MVQKHATGLRNEILTLLEKQPLTMYLLVENIHNASVEEISRTLDSLVQERRVTRCTGGTFKSQIKTYWFDTQRLYKFREQFEQLIEVLPIPHELDSDWRFTFDAITTLLQRAAFAVTDDHSVCCLGSPSIALMLALSGYRGEIVVADRNARLLGVLSEHLPGLNCVAWDITDAFPVSLASNFDVVFTDPPWYTDSCERFVKSAGKLLRIGGLLALVIFPNYHSDNALSQKLHIFNALVKSQLVPFLIEPDLLEYQAKSTIINQTSDSGSRLPIDWLRGDLILAIKTNKSDRVSSSFLRDEVWKEFNIDKSSIRLRVDQAEPYYIKPQINRMFDTASQPIVTLSDEERERVNLWTAGNQVFQVQGIWVVEIIIKSIIDGLDMEYAVEDIAARFGLPKAKVKRDIKEIYSYIQEVIERESALSASTLSNKSSTNP